jgi:hypothetical protein
MTIVIAVAVIVVVVVWLGYARRGEIVGTQRQDRHPDLQLDADVDKRAVTVSEGDLWNGRGRNRSGRVAVWQLSEITTAGVSEEIRSPVGPAMSASSGGGNDRPGLTRWENRTGTQGR